MKIFHIYKISLIACAIFFSPTFIQAQNFPYLDESEDIEVRVKDALSRMTLEEKVALCHAQGKFTSSGVPRLGIPELWMSDGPHGVRAEINWNNWHYAGWTSDSVTVFPALTCLAATWNPSLAAKYGKALGQEARYRKKDVLLGPGINIYRTPLGGRNFEYMGEDPYLTGAMCVPYIQEIQKNGVAACVKHFALNNQETWRDHIDVNLSERALREIYLPAFEKAVREGKVYSVMGAYNKVRGEHACQSNLLLNEILKTEWGFDGVVISDWGGVHDTFEAAVNGLDIEMGSYTNGLNSTTDFGFDDYYLALPYLKMLKEGKIDSSTVDDKAERILRLIMRTAMNTSKPFGSLCTDEHYQVAREVGSEGIVLLKNDAIKKTGKPLLPIMDGKYKRILIVGDNAVKNLNEGGGSSDLKAKIMISPLDALKSLYGDKISYTKGYSTNVTQLQADSLRDEAVKLSKASDLIIIVGGLSKDRYQDDEGYDRLSYGLPFGQNELIEDIWDVNKNIVLILLSGNAVEMPWVDKIPAILQGWYLGSMGGYSLTDVLSGKVNPSGKLPFSFPKKLEDCGAMSHGEIAFPGDSIREEYLEDILVGYRLHDTKNIPALFPFGHGLSYTTFSYGKPELSHSLISLGEDLTLSLTLTNTGETAGKEVVQLYVGQDSPTCLRPQKELKRFKKVYLNPKESQRVDFTLKAEDFAYYNTDDALWKTDPGKYTIFIGSSSSDIRQRISIEFQ
ncbi:MAG: glycoside hydrolase family 3 C-terminal domain-containing protein [Prevotella sp.]|nr:glycoside hydrolase family 3 C-terminal domain-containing protein [Prevotella sp.]